MTIQNTRQTDIYKTKLDELSLENNNSKSSKGL